MYKVISHFLLQQKGILLATLVHLLFGILLINRQAIGKRIGKRGQGEWMKIPANVDVEVGTHRHKWDYHLAHVYYTE